MSKKEARVAADLHLQQQVGEISELREQVKIELVPGRDKVRSISYICDFVYRDKEGTVRYLDAKGVRTEVFTIKAKLCYLLLGITVEEC